MAALVTVFLRLASRRSKERFRWGPVYLLALIGVTSHTFMDFANTYGVRWWLPFSSAWFSWDISSLVDLWLWAAMLACLAGPALAGLISREVGARPGRGAAAAAAGLVFTAAWWGGRDLMHQRALAMLDARLYGIRTASAGDSSERSEGFAPLRVAAFPTAANPFLWRGYVETDRFYQMLDVDVRRPLDPTAGRIYYKPEQSPILDAALRTRTASEFLSFARYRYITVERRDDGYRVRLRDFRFGAGGRDAFLCTIDLDSGLRVVRERFSF